MCCAYPNLFFEIDLKERMAQELDRFTKFHLQVRNYCPNSRFPLRTRVWFLRMDKEAYKERFGQFSEIFHYGNDITIVPYHGFKTWDTNSISLKQLVIQHNEQIRNIVVITVYNTKGSCKPITINNSVAAVASDL